MVEHADPQMVYAALSEGIRDGAGTGDLTDFWLENASHLRGFGLIFAFDGESPRELPPVELEFSRGGFIRSGFSKRNLFYLNNEVAEQMARSGDVLLPTEVRFSLDTQIVSYVANAIANGSAAGNLVEPVLNYLTAHDYECDGWMFLLENMESLRDGPPQEGGGLLRNLRALEVLKNWDKAKYLTTGEVASTLSPGELDQATEDTWQSVQAIGNDDHNSYHQNWKVLYATLLAASRIQLSGPQRSPLRKMGDLLVLVRHQVGLFMPRALVVSAQFFQRGQSFQFFAPVQQNNPNILRKIRGMAWDLQFLRALEDITGRSSQEDWFYAPYTITFDKRLVEVIDLYPIRALLTTPQGAAWAIPERDVRADLAATFPGIEETLVDTFALVNVRQRLAGRREAGSRIAASISENERWLAELVGGAA